MWIVLLSLHLVGLVGYTLFLRRSALSTVNKYLLAAVMSTVIFLPSIIFLFVGKISFHHSTTQWISLIGSGFMMTGLQFATILALKNLEASLWTIIYNLRLVFATILGYLFLGELPSHLQLLGGIIIFASILFLNLHKHKRFRERAIVIGILATIWISFHAVLEKYNVNTNGFENYMFISGGISTAMLWSIVFAKKISLRKLAHFKNNESALLLFTRFLSAWAYVYALKFGSLAVTNYVSGMSVVLIVLFGIFVLDEKTYLRQKLTAALTSAFGLTLILLSRL